MEVPIAPLLPLFQRPFRLFVNFQSICYNLSSMPNPTIDTKADLQLESLAMANRNANAH